MTEMPNFGILQMTPLFIPDDSADDSAFATSSVRKATSPSLVTPLFIPFATSSVAEGGGVQRNPTTNEVKRTEPPRHPVGSASEACNLEPPPFGEAVLRVSGWEPSAPIRSGSKRFLDSFPRISEADSEKNEC